jgi:1-acyl-sn-glycerol-3-phosphate acyltransferase
MWQHLSFAVTKLFFIVSRSRIAVLDDWRVDNQYNYVIASTHVYWFDPFMTTTALGWKRLRPLLPCRFIAAPKFLVRPHLRNAMRHLGSYPSHEFHDWAYGLDASIHLMEQKNTIVIFPEGRITRGARPTPKHGVTTLAKQKGTLVVPVLITPKESRILPSFEITVGTPYDASGHSAESIMARIYTLAEKK